MAAAMPSTNTGSSSSSSSSSSNCSGSWFRGGARGGRKKYYYSYHLVSSLFVLLTIIIIISLRGKQKVKDPKDVTLKNAEHDVNGTIILETTTTTTTSITDNRDSNTVGTIVDDDVTTSTPPDGVLWIHVQDWSEGISHWTETFSQVLVLCKTLNATFVLPEITDGRLVGRVRGNILLSDIFNMTLLKQRYHSKMITFSDFQQQQQQQQRNNNNNNGIVVFDVCFLKSKQATCENGIPNEFRADSSAALEQAILISDERPVVLKIHQLWDQGMTKLQMMNMDIGTSSSNNDNKNKNKNNRLFLVPPDQVALVHDKLLRFSDAMEALADQALREMGISEGNNNYAVIHWRAEKGGMDYLQCAEGIVATKKAMETSDRFAQYTNMTFVLASSLSMDTSKEWGGAFREAENTTAPEALAYLMNDYEDHQFRKINQDVLGVDTKDLIVNSIVDLIVARRATAFASCTRTCYQPYRYCRVCNYPGHYAEYIMELRRDLKKPSLPCWPQTTSDVEGILALDERNANLTG
jgi:hypothetical protein